MIWPQGLEVAISWKWLRKIQEAAGEVFWCQLRRVWFLRIFAILCSHMLSYQEKKTISLLWSIYWELEVEQHRISWSELFYSGPKHKGFRVKKGELHVCNERTHMRENPLASFFQEFYYTVLLPYFWHVLLEIKCEGHSNVFDDYLDRVESAQNVFQATVFQVVEFRGIHD